VLQSRKVRNGGSVAKAPVGATRANTMSRPSGSTPACPLPSWTTDRPGGRRQADVAGTTVPPVRTADPPGQGRPLKRPALMQDLSPAHSASMGQGAQGSGLRAEDSRKHPPGASLTRPRPAWPPLPAP
jgi:hypothetical protein